MKTTTTVSSDIIDKRKHAAAGAFGGVLVTLLAVLGIRTFATGSPQDPDRDLVHLVSAALDRGQDYWSAQVPGYRRAHVVLYEDSTATACGVGLTSSGPFLCPADRTIYVDLSFIRAIKGDLARAYVIEHEIGHAVQQTRGELDRGATSVQVELEADCNAGTLMRVEQQSDNLSPGDIEGALAEAAAVGDDRLNPGSSPEDWTHGSSAQRVAAVQAGIAGTGCHL